jgi:hypothetical protein
MAIPPNVRCFQLLDAVDWLAETDSSSVNPKPEQARDP